MVNQAYDVPPMQRRDLLENTTYRADLPSMEPFFNELVPAFCREKIEEYHRFVEDKLRAELESVTEFLKESVNDRHSLIVIVECGVYRSWIRC